MICTSPLARFSSLDDLEPDLLAPPTIAEDRAHTPTGDEYSNLGTLKRGSLMVTNGPPSPLPSSGLREFTGGRQSEDEYFTASENGSVPASPTKLPPPSSQQPTNSGGCSFEDYDPRASDQYDSIKAPVAKRSGSPLKREIRPDSPIWESEREREPSLHRRPRVQRSATSLIAKSENHSLFSNTSSDEDLKSRKTHQRTKSQSAISLAAEYMAELPPSPHAATFGSTRELPAKPSPKPSLSSLYIAYGDSNTPSSIEENQDYELSRAVSSNQIQVDNEILAHTALRSHPPSVKSPLKSALKSQRSSLVKTDSGYSSSVSTSVDGTQTLEMGQSNLSAVESVADLSPNDVAPKPVIKPKKSSSSPAPSRPQSRPQSGISERSVWPATYKIEDNKTEEAPTTPERKEVDRPKSWKKSVRRSLPKLRSADSTPTKTSTTSTPDTKPSPKPANKLQKKRRLSQPAVAIRSSHDLESEVPRVPSSVFARFSERLATSPALQHLDRTYEDTFGSDARRESANSGSAPEVAPIVPASYFPDADQNNLGGTANRTSRKTHPETAAPKPPPHRHSFSRKHFGRFSSSKNEDEEITGVSDFGTVASSLGSSPYDVAKGNQPLRPHSATSGNAQYPHQLGSDSRQYGPQGGWDAETASKFAHMRSRERAAATEAAERRPLRNQRPPISVRPQSYHEQSHMQHPKRPNTYERPKSIHGSVPQSQENAHSRFSLYDQSRAQQEFYGPRTVNTTPVNYDHIPRSASPVKNIVSVFEARAALAPSPSPRPPQSPIFDWSEQSRLWRERKINAQTSVRSTSSNYAESVTTTTTITAFLADEPSQPNYPTVQTSYSSTPTTMTQTTYSPKVTTTQTIYSPTATTTQTSSLLRPVNGTQTEYTSGATTTTRNRVSQIPTYSQFATPKQQKTREQMHSSARAQRSRHSTSPTPEPSPIPAQMQPPSLRVGSGSKFGRNGAGNRRNSSARTQAIRTGYGVDFRDIPVRNAPI
jgi:hypothetical protein